MRARAVLVAVFLVLAAVTGSQDWEAASRKIKRLPPSAFPELPAEARSALEKQGCTIPQSFADEKPHNVVRGEFARKGQVDFAVLCSRNQSSAIVVFWGGKAGCGKAELAAAPDTQSLQVAAGESVQYSRMIAAADAKFITRHFEEYGGTRPPRNMDHLGVEDRFLEKASVVHYCEAGKWLRLTGSD